MTLEMTDKAYQSGMRKIVEWIEQHQLIKPDTYSITRFEPFYQIEQKELKEHNKQEIKKLDNTTTYTILDGGVIATNKPFTGVDFKLKDRGV